MQVSNEYCIFEGLRKKEQVILWPVKPKMFTVWPFREKFANLFYTINYEVNKNFYLCAEGKKHG